MSNVSHDSSPRITQVTIVNGEKTALLTRSDGKVADYPITPMRRDPGSRIHAVAANIDRQELAILTTLDDTISIPFPETSDLAKRDGKPTIYLDQNQWSTLVNTLHWPDKVAPSELEAARIVIDLVLRRKILLPLSAAHMSETGKWGNSDRRYKHGLVLASLSGGWLMRDPIDVRTREILNAMQPDGLWINPVVTRDQRVLFSGRPEEYGFSLLTPTEPPDEVEFMIAQMGTIDALLDEGVVEMGASPGWVDKNQRFAEWISEATSERSQRRDLVNRFFLHDTSTELATAAAVAGFSKEELERWITGPANDAFTSMPCLSTFRECLFDKLSDPKNKWESNDLTDMYYLTCAVAYCDFTVCERSLCSILTQGAKRLGRDCRAFRRLADLIPALQSSLLEVG